MADMTSEPASEHTQTFTVRLTNEDARALGPTPFCQATIIHALVRREVRRLGAPGTTAIEYKDSDGRIMRESADPPGLLVGPTCMVPSGGDADSTPLR